MTTRCTFANTTISQGFDFTFGPGIQPSICSVTTIPHLASLPQVGELRFWTEGGGEMSFPNCCLEEPRLVVGSSGQKWVLPIKDRRWKWHEGWGPIYGHYNVLKKSATYVREKTPRELAALLLQAMGEADFDVSRLPNTPRPEVHWDGAHAASELDALCASLSCVVVLNPLSDRVELWPIGGGGTLPTADTQGASYTPILPIKPEKIIVEAGPTRFQTMFHLRAVGFDVDEKWRPIDELSYMPAGGWGRANFLHGFPEITGAYTRGNRTLPIRDLARASVYRCYQVDGIGAAGNWALPHLHDAALMPQSRKDLQLFTTKVDEEISPADGGLRPLPATLYGKWYKIESEFIESLVAAFQRGEQLQEYTEGFQFDATTGVLTLNEPAVLFQNGQAVPAEFRFETSCIAGRNGVYDRVKVERSLTPGWSTPPRLIQRTDLASRVVMRYAADGTVSNVENDGSNTAAQLRVWLNVAAAEYQHQSGATVRYSEIRPFSPDGLIQQISWSGGGGRPPSTTVSQAQRHNRFVEPPNEYRQRLLAKRLQQVNQSVIGVADAAATWGAGVV